MISEIQLTPTQTAGAKAIQEWYEHGHNQVFHLAGYAGTGKTTIVRTVIDMMNLDHVHYCAYTGKAAAVLRDKGNTPSSTIHSLIYYPSDKAGEFILKEGLDTDPDLIVLDECSTVEEDMFDDLRSFGIKILVLGDLGQLKPIKGKTAYQDPDFELTEIHRQAEDSGIIELATKARQGEKIELQDKEDAYVGKLDEFSDLYTKDMQVLCGSNRTRMKFNNKIRKSSYPFPLPEEPVMCLKNSKQYSIFNGQMFTCVSHGLDHYDTVEGMDEKLMRSVEMRLRNDEGREFTVLADFRYFLACANNNLKMLEELKEIDRKSFQKPIPFDFCHAITVHKSQGSQWKNVLVIDESFMFKDSERNWLYTAITRAADKVKLLKVKGVK